MNRPGAEARVLRHAGGGSGPARQAHSAHGEATLLCATAVWDAAGAAGGPGSSSLAEGGCLSAGHPSTMAACGGGAQGAMWTERASVTPRPAAASPDWAVPSGGGGVDATRGADHRRRWLVGLSPCCSYRPRRSHV